jgi:hypothetical protein
MLRKLDGDYEGASVLVARLVEELDRGIALLGDFLRGHPENYPVFVFTCLDMQDDGDVPIATRNLMTILTSMAVEADRREGG